MKIRSTNSHSMYWVPDECVDTGLYERIPSLKETDLQIGDIVPYGTMCEKVLGTRRDVNKNVLWIKYQKIDAGGPGIISEEETWPSTRYEDVFRPIIAVPKHTADTVAVKKPDSMWNGVCPRCGRGTYTGGWKVEHDGPCG